MRQILRLRYGTVRCGTLPHDFCHNRIIAPGDTAGASSWMAITAGRFPLLKPHIPLVRRFAELYPDPISVTWRVLPRVRKHEA